jgi:DNA-binding response OmpR family regulator
MQSTACILIVDDHRDIGELVSRVFAKEGFRVGTAPVVPCKRCSRQRVSRMSFEISNSSWDNLAASC